MSENIIYNEDCQDTMLLRNIKFDYVLTSPPYNLGGDFHTFSKGKRVTYGDYDGFSDNLPEHEYQKQQISVLNQLYDGLNDGGICFYNHKVRIKKRKIIHPLEWISKSKFNRLKQTHNSVNKTDVIYFCYMLLVTERNSCRTATINTSS